MNLDHLIEESHSLAIEKGWYENDNGRSFAELVMLVVTELSESVEAYRDGHGISEIIDGEGGKPEGVPIEIADAIIRIADMCGHFDIPIVEAINIKMEYNKTRPSRHGGKVI
jgi:NTP pyrophosphatase (non-canonical NTP hydrolase)